MEGDVVGVMDLTFSLEESDSKISTLVTNISIISIILTLITIGLIFFIVKKATNPIEDLKDGFTNLLHSNDTNIKLNVTSKDEIGEVADLFNSYMNKVREGLRQDEKVIEEATDVLEKTANGFFVYKVHERASNPHVEDLKNRLNEMIAKTKDTIDKINETLNHYAESKFDFKINDELVVEIEDSKKLVLEDMDGRSPSSPNHPLMSEENPLISIINEIDLYYIKPSECESNELLKTNYANNISLGLFIKLDCIS